MVGQKSLKLRIEVRILAREPSSKGTHMSTLFTVLMYTFVGAAFLIVSGLLVFGVMTVMSHYPQVIMLGLFLVFSFLFGWLFLGGKVDDA